MLVASTSLTAGTFRLLRSPHRRPRRRPPGGGGFLLAALGDRRAGQPPGRRRPAAAVACRRAGRHPATAAAAAAGAGLPRHGRRPACGAGGLWPGAGGWGGWGGPAAGPATPVSLHSMMGTHHTCTVAVTCKPYGMLSVHKRAHKSGVPAWMAARHCGAQHSTARMLTPLPSASRCLHAPITALQASVSGAAGVWLSGQRDGRDRPFCPER